MQLVLSSFWAFSGCAGGLLTLLSDPYLEWRAPYVVGGEGMAWMTLCPLKVQAVSPAPPTCSLTPGAGSGLCTAPGPQKRKRKNSSRGSPSFPLGGSSLLSALSSFPPMTWYVPFQECRKPDPRFSIQLKPLVPPSQGQENEKSLREHPWGILLASSVFSAASLFFLSLHCPPALPHPFRHGTPGERA